MGKEERVPLTEHERSMVTLIATRDGITEDEAASKLVKESLARRTKKQKGGGGRILPLRRK